MTISKICCSIFFTALLIITQASKISASMPIFVEGFDSYNSGETPNSWTTVRSMQWNNYSLPCMYGSDISKWIVTEDTTNNKVIKIAIKGPSCVIELKPNNFNIPDPSNYQLDLDMTFGNEVNVHRNIAYRYDDSIKWYGIKFFNSRTIEFQKANPGTISNPGSSIYSGFFQPNTTYHMTIVTKNDLVSFYINDVLSFQYLDYYPILKSGGIALQASAGPYENTKNNITYFDNIVVSDLREYLHVPHMSQADPLWSDDIYDHAPAWANPNSTFIKNWGCALTSASMVLNFHGHQTNPQSLNQYLIDHNGYNAWGGVIWSYFTKFARENKNTSDDTSLKDLEFTYPEYSDTQLVSDIQTNQPDIIKLLMNPDTGGNHFIVATGPVDASSSIFIQDPANLNSETTLLADEYGDKTSLRLARFVPSMTNLSYLWIYGQDSLSKLSVTNNQQVTSFEASNITRQIPNSDIFIDGGIKDALSDNISPEYLSFHHPKPLSGLYQINFTAKYAGFHTIDFALFDESANDVRKTITIYSSPSTDRQIDINYDSQIAQNSRFTHKSSVPIMLELIDYGYNQNMMTKNVHKHIQQMLGQIAKQLPKQHGVSSKALIGAFTHQLQTYYSKGLIQKIIFQALNEELMSL